MSTPEPAIAPAQPAVKAPSPTARPSKGAASRKKRAPRRRGRGHGDLESDDEIQREAASSDSEDDDDDGHHHDLDASDSEDSATDDSDTEPGSEDVPSNVQSPGRSKDKDVGVEGVTHINGAAAPFFDSPATWAEMVTDENGRADAGLPVIDFAEFSEAAKIPARPTKKSQKQKQKKANAAAAAAASAAAAGTAEASTTAAPPTEEAQADRAEETRQVQSNGASHQINNSGPHDRRPGQTARQAYQERLEKDPAFVPKVGGFWGHDDRLMDKDLRSLSGWWRGQWHGQARGRGRGGWGGRGGGRGGHVPAFQAPAEEELQPVDRTWTHDGFEEMSRKEEERAVAGRGARGGFRGRGGFAPRGRGTFKNGPLAAAGAPNGTVPSPTSQRVRPANSKKKGETPWSQANSHLFPDNKKGIVVKVPGGNEAQLVKRELQAQVTTNAPAEQITAVVKDLQYVVRLPTNNAGQTPEPTEQLSSVTAPPPHATEEGSASHDALTASPTQDPVAAASANHSEDPSSSQPSPAVISQLEQLSIDPPFSSDPDRQAKTEEAVLRNPSQEGRSESIDITDRPALPPLQTVFTPPPPPLNHSSPYSFPPALPPGIALNQHGMPFEMATGRPVYLQAPPPPPMYNPRPMMHSHHSSLSYGHAPHPVMSPDFLAQPSSHTPPMNGFIDPSTGAPIFSFPRASARLEIRAPDDPLRSPPSNGKVAANRGPSKLRTAASVFEPSRPSVTGQSNGEGYYPSLSTPSDGSALPPYDTDSGLVPEDAGGAQQQQQQQHQHMAPMMGYNPYQQPYYYPEAYGYPAYMDMSQQQHHGQYEGYNVDQSQHQGTVYY